MTFTRQAQAPERMNLRPVAAAVAMPPLKSVCLLDQLRERIRLLHYSLRTEEAYVYWARAFIRLYWLRNPAEMGKAEVVVLRDKVAIALDGLQGVHRMLARLRYGTGMRSTEGLQLQGKEVDFAHRALMVREGKGGRCRGWPCRCGHAFGCTGAQVTNDGLAPAERGSRFSRKTSTRPIRAVVRCTGTTCAPKPSSGRSSGRCCRPRGNPPNFHWVEK